MNYTSKSFDSSKQYSSKFRNVQLLSTETAEGTRIQLRETKAFLISFIGLCFELYDMIPDIYHYIKQWKEKRHKSQEEEDQKAVVVADNDTAEEPNQERGQK